LAPAALIAPVTPKASYVFFSRVARMALAKHRSTNGHTGRIALASIEALCHTKSLDKFCALAAKTKLTALKSNS